MNKDYVGGLDKCPHCGSYADKFCTNEVGFLGRMPFGILCNGCPAMVTLYTTGGRYPDSADWEEAKKYWNRRTKPE